MSAEDDAIEGAWRANAGRWTDAVRGGCIASRAAGTDRAVLDLIGRLAPDRVLDVGCGEGWLVRRLREVADVVGIDGSADLIEAARRADPDGRYAVLTYQQLEDGAAVPGGPFDLVVCNFALFGDPLAPFLMALGNQLGPGGHLLVQTLHPWSACGEGAYRDGWRHESFSSFGTPGWQPMPWYFRTLASWLTELDQAGFRLHRLDEALDPTSGRPLSLILLATGEREA